jgi:hypothetical protein
MGIMTTRQKNFAVIYKFTHHPESPKMPADTHPIDLILRPFP